MCFLFVFFLTLRSFQNYILHAANSTQALNLTGTVLIIFVSLIIFISLLTSFAVVCRKREWFNIECDSTNPYKLVYKVTKFACQHKHRSVAVPSPTVKTSCLLDSTLGKVSMGGPFTTEEVEDVKVFYEILKILFAAGPLYLLADATFSIGLYIPNNHSLNSSADFDFNKILHLCNGNLSPLLIVTMIPLCIPYPLDKTPRLLKV